MTATCVGVGKGGVLDHPLHVQTPLLKSKKLSDKVGSNVWLKLDNVQNSGSFKIRGIGYLCQKVYFYMVYS